MRLRRGCLRSGHANRICWKMVSFPKLRSSQDFVVEIILPFNVENSPPRWHVVVPSVEEVCEDRGDSRVRLTEDHLP